MTGGDGVGCHPPSTKANEEPAIQHRSEGVRGRGSAWRPLSVEPRANKGSECVWHPPSVEKWVNEGSGCVWLPPGVERGQTRTVDASGILLALKRGRMRA